MRNDKNKDNNQNLEPEQLDSVAGGTNTGSNYDQSICRPMGERTERCLTCSAFDVRGYTAGATIMCKMGFFDYDVPH